MRPIKFRGKKPYTGNWVCGNLLRICGGSMIYFGSDTDTIEPDIESSNPIAVELFKDEVAVVLSDTVGQFTGLYDKNGTEIYEGDIILCKGKYIYSVEWKSDGFFMISKLYGGVTSITSFGPNQLEIIGNIHDNPEMLSTLA